MKKEANIRSMTGFGRGQSKNFNCTCYVEIKSVNHRYLEVNSKIPDEFLKLDLEIKRIIKNYLRRGTVYLNLNFVYEGGVDLEIDDLLFEKLLRLEKQVEERHGISQPLNIHYILSYPGVVKQVHPDVPFREKRALVLDALKIALDALVKSREREGRNLKKDLEERIERLEKYLSIIESREKEREEVLAQRMEQEVQALDSQATAVGNIPSTAEEIVRLRSHFRTVRLLLSKGGMIGRELDFLAQEMNREINTLSAKALSSKTAQTVVKVKTEIEKIREQALNIE